MRIKSVRIKNFRSFADETIQLEPYSCLVGANGAGKSTLLCALNVFFRESANATGVDTLSVEDFHQKNTAERIEITLTFVDLSDQARGELRDYVRNDQLIVSAVAAFDEAKGRAPVEQVGSRMGVPDFAEFFDVYKSGPATEVQRVFDDLRGRYPGIPNPAGRSKDSKKDALAAFEADPQNSHLLNAIESKDQFYGIAGPSKLKNFIQWVYVPAVKDATDEEVESRDGALGKLLARTVRARLNFKDRLSEIEQAAQAEYQQLLEANQGSLDEVAGSLSRRLGKWSHPDVNIRLNWSGSGISIREPAARVTAGERGFEGELARFGHGFQRSYLLALLQELAEVEGDQAPTLILGVEEPELYQHPPQARYLAQILQALAARDDQVIVTTHSPYFVGGSSFECVRVVRKEAGNETKVYGTTHGRFAERYANADERPPLAPRAVEVQMNEVLRPGLNEMFFAAKAVLVEGQEDVAHIVSWIALTDRMGEFRSRGVHFIPVDGKRNLARPLIVAQELKLPFYVVFDGDRTEANHPCQVADNTRLLRILGMEGAPLFPDDDRWGDHFTQWADSLGAVVDAELQATLGREEFDRIIERARVLCGHAPSLEKHTMFIQHKMELAYAANGRSARLDRLCESLLAE